MGANDAVKKHMVKSFAARFAIALGVALIPTAALAQETTPPPAMPPPSPPPPAQAASTPRMVGGHIGIALPLITFHFNHPTGAKSSTSISDQTTIAIPIGISIHTAPEWVVDFETIVGNTIHPVNALGGTALTVDPGIVYTGGPVALGLRLKFDIGGPPNVGIIPLANKGLVDLGVGTWFVEAALPITLTDLPGAGTNGSNQKQLDVTIVVHTGIGF
jgi:hypothetical protein